MQVTPVQHTNVYVPVQPIAPIKSKAAQGSEEATEKAPDADDAPKPKAATPPHVGRNLDISA